MFKYTYTELLAHSLKKRTLLMHFLKKTPKNKSKILIFQSRHYSFYYKCNKISASLLKIFGTYSKNHNNSLLSTLSYFLKQSFIII